MAICKCKTCGGDLNITELDNVAECEYCGTRQTVPSADSEKKLTLFNRANKLRLGGDFDKAAGIYESIVAEFPEEAEAYWGIVLCKYGIEYVTDPATGKKIPTCHRSSFDSVLDDESFEQACENADFEARRLYREEAKRIDEIRKGIIEISAKEEPYDIFICYKETDEVGGRTVDSAIAQDVYTALTEKGYRVFFARISLEDKLGREYEPFIFAALNSAKIMLVFGTDYEYFNAAWVKNEWSRFLQLIAAGQKKTLIPCYKDIDAYDMPKEFARLQSQDMGKVGAIQDLLRGIEKILPKAAPVSPAPAQIVVGPASATTQSLLKRAFLFLEDGNWASADEYAEKVLDIEPENAEAYLVKAMAEYRVAKTSDLRNYAAAGANTLLAEGPFTLNACGPNKLAAIKVIRSLTGFGLAEAKDLVEHLPQKVIPTCTPEEFKTLLGDLSKAGASFTAMKTTEPLDKNANIQKALRFGGDALKSELNGYISEQQKAEEERREAERIRRQEEEEKQRALEEARRKAEEIERKEREERQRILDAQRKKNLDLYWKQQEELKKNARRVIDAILTKYRDPSSADPTQSLAAARQRVSFLEAVCRDYNMNASQLLQKQNAQQEAQAQINALQTKMNALGVFASKEKKALKDEIQQQAQLQQSLSEEINVLLNKLNGFQTAEQARNALDAAKKTAADLESRAPNDHISFEQALDVLQKDEDIRKCAKELHPVAADILPRIILRMPTVFYGRYPRADAAVKAPIEWIVLKQEANRVLLISAYALDYRCYNDTQHDNSWEHSALRKWLNSDFLKTAFNQDEQNSIQAVSAADHWHPSDARGAQSDKVFLLSAKDAETYFASDSARACTATKYALTPSNTVRKIIAINGKQGCFWWLSTPGRYKATAALITCEGKVNLTGNTIDSALAVRPAVWIKL